MGFVYKLIPEVTSFIIEQKQGDPKITCQNLAGQVFLKFGHQVSKSSVHELLKRSHVITPRERKTKDKFKIPLEKKFELSKALAPFSTILPPAVVEAKAEIKKEPVIKREQIKNAGEIVLKAALWDLSMKPILGIENFSQIDSVSEEKLTAEWKYLTAPVFAIKIETAQSHFFIDARFSSVHNQNPQHKELSAPIERLAFEVTDQIFNNISPLIIQEWKLDSIGMLENFIAAFENHLPVALTNISLIGIKDRVFLDFKDPLPRKREFIAGLSSTLPEIQAFIDSGSMEGKILGVRILKKNHRIFISNASTMSYDEIMKNYWSRFPEELFLIEEKAESNPEEAQGSLRDRLKSRARAFFPGSLSEQSLDHILGLPGEEAVSEDGLEITLQIPESFLEGPQLNAAVGKINNWAIKDYASRKLHIQTSQQRQ